MTTKIKSPTYPESVSDGTISNWVKKEGENVKQDELIAEIETDKIVLEVLSPIDGEISKIIKNEGDIVLSGELIAEVKKNNTSLSASESIEEDIKNKKTNISTENNKSMGHGPAIRRLLDEYKINPEDVVGTGKDGRITKTDINNYLSKTMNKKTNESEVKPVKDSSREEERVPMSRMRTTIAKRLLSVTQETAMLTTFNEVDMHHPVVLAALSCMNALPRILSSSKTDGGNRSGATRSYGPSCVKPKDLAASRAFRRLQ